MMKILRKSWMSLQAVPNIKKLEAAVTENTSII